MDKVEAWKFETVGTACGNRTGLHKLAAAIIEIAIEEQLLPITERRLTMTKKKRKCCICGADLTSKNYAQVYDDELKKVVVVCPGRCYRTKMMKGWLTR